MICRGLLAICLLCAGWAADIDQLWDYDKPALSESRFREAFAAAGKAGDKASQAELLTQIARAQGLQGDLQAAGATLDGMVAELGQLPAVVSVRYLLERGRLINAAGEPKKAWRWFRNALALAQRHGLDFYAIDAMHMLGIVDSGSNAIDWDRKAIALAEQSTQPRARDWLGSLYNNLGWAYRDQKDLARSLDYLRLAQAWHEQRGNSKPLLIARWGVAKLLRETGELDKALAIQLDLERSWTKLGEEDGYVFEEIGETLLSLGRVADARPYFRRALQALAKDDWLLRNEPARFARMQQLAR